LNARGFTLIEMLVVVIAVGIMAGLALDRLLPLIGRAERVAFLQVEGQLKSALLLEAADRIAAGESATLPELASVNPMSLLLEAPANYLGSLAQPDPARIPGRSWYYDEHDRRLVYRVGKLTRFDPAGGPVNRIEFRVDFVYRDRDGDGRYDAARDRFDGLRLVPVHAFSWPD
jgi:prepilin-type N-terminal cleavage/methylation domain-containing protein